MGDQSHPPGRYYLRDLVYLRCRRRADVALGDGTQDRSRCLQRATDTDDGPALQRGAVQSRTGDASGRRDRHVHLCKRQCSDVCLYGKQRDADQADYAAVAHATTGGHRVSLAERGIASVLDLVHEGFGYAILPIHALRAHRLARDFVASPIVNPKLTIQLSLVVSAQRPSTPLTRGLLSLARKTALQVLSASKSGRASVD